MPGDIVDRLNREIKLAIELPEIRQHLENEMVQTNVMTAVEFTQFMQSEINKWAPTARKLVDSK